MSECEPRESGDSVAPVGHQLSAAGEPANSCMEARPVRPHAQNSSIQNGVFGVEQKISPEEAKERFDDSEDEAPGEAVRR